MKIEPSYYTDGVSFNLLEPGDPFWWVDTILIKTQKVEFVNAISLKTGSAFFLEPHRIVRKANVKVVEDLGP